MNRHFLDFERPVAELEGKIEELRRISTTGELNIADEIGRLQSSADRVLRHTYSRLTPWQKVQVARHPERPHCLDYISGLITEFVPLAGDRAFAEDKRFLDSRNARPLRILAEYLEPWSRFERYGVRVHWGRVELLVA